MPINDYLLLRHRIDGANQYLLTNNYYNCDTYNKFQVIFTFTEAVASEYNSQHRIYIPIEYNRLISGGQQSANFSGFRIFFGLHYGTSQATFFIGFGKLNGLVFNENSIGQLFIHNSNKIFKLSSYMFNTSFDISQGYYSIDTSNFPDGVSMQNLNTEQQQESEWPYALFSQYIDLNSNYIGDPININFNFVQNSHQEIIVPSCPAGGNHDLNKGYNAINLSGQCTNCGLNNTLVRDLRYCNKCNQDIEIVYCTNCGSQY